jgi:uncharacterized protein (TIGR00369 family)
MNEHEHNREDPVARVRASFERQSFMRTLGVSLLSVAPGEVVLELPFADTLTQQHGFLHAGAVSAVVDSACGYAALSLMPPEAGVLSIEFKVNMLAPAAGDRFRAIGRVVRSGRTITVCSGELVAFRGESSTQVALMQATMMAIRDRPGVSD